MAPGELLVVSDCNVLRATRVSFPTSMRRPDRTQVRNDRFGILTGQAKRRHRRRWGVSGQSLSGRQQTDLVLVAKAGQAGDVRRLGSPLLIEKRWRWHGDRGALK